MEAINIGYEGMQGATNDREKGGGLLRCYKWQAELLKDLQAC